MSLRAPRGLLTHALYSSVRHDVKYMAIWLHAHRHRLRAFINFFSPLMSTSSQYMGPRSPHITTEILLAWHSDSTQYLPREPELLQHYTLIQRVCQVWPNCFAQQPLNLPVSCPRFFWATSSHYPSSLQHPEKAAPSSAKGNHINIKKTERLIRTDIWYYRICRSIYELDDKWYRNQEAITILWGRS